MSSELFDRAAAVAGRVHRRRVERRAFPARRADWCTANYVDEYFRLNSAQPRRFYRDPTYKAIHAYPETAAHASLYLPLGTAPQAPVIEEAATD